MAKLKEKKLFRGPLEKAQGNIDEFVSNLYFSYIYDQSVKKHQQLQEEYIEAFLENDASGMESTEREIEMYEGSFEIAAYYMLNDVDLLS